MFFNLALTFYLQAIYIIPIPTRLYKWYYQHRDVNRELVKKCYQIPVALGRV